MTSKVTTPCAGSMAVDDAALRLCTNLARGGFARRGGGYFVIGVILAAVQAAGPDGRVASLEAPCGDEIDSVEPAAKPCSVRSLNPRHSLACAMMVVGDSTALAMCSKGSGRGARRNVRNFPAGPKDEDGAVLFLLGGRGGRGGTRCRSSWSFIPNSICECENFLARFALCTIGIGFGGMYVDERRSRGKELQQEQRVVVNPMPNWAMAGEK